MKKFTTYLDLVTGVEVGNSIASGVDGFDDVPLSNLRFDGANIVNGESYADFFIDASGIKHIVQHDAEWQALSCSFSDDLVEDGIWRVKTAVDSVNNMKSVKIDEINAATKATIVGGFTSDALGSDHRYQSDSEDQLNLSGVTASGSDWPFKCSDDAGATWAYVLHTSAQLTAVTNDGITHKSTALVAGETLKAQVLALPGDATQANIDAIGA